MSCSDFVFANQQLEIMFNGLAFAISQVSKNYQPIIKTPNSTDKLASSYVCSMSDTINTGRKEPGISSAI